MYYNAMMMMMMMMMMMITMMKNNGISNNVDIFISSELNIELVKCCQKHH